MTTPLSRPLSSTLWAFAAAAASALLMLANPAAAQPAVANASLMITSGPSEGQYCMDVQGNGQANGTPVFLYHCHGGENQRWVFTRNTDGTSSIVGTGGMCLDVQGANRADGTPVQINQCHFNANQRFRVLEDGHLRDMNSGKCLTLMAERDEGGDRGRGMDGQGGRRDERRRGHDERGPRFVERDGQPIVLMNCAPWPTQVWRVMR